MAGQNCLLKSTGTKRACGSIVGHWSLYLPLGNSCLRKTLGAAGMKLQEVEPKNQEFRDNGNNPIQLLGTMRVELVSNG